MAMGRSEHDLIAKPMTPIEVALGAVVRAPMRQPDDSQRRLLVAPLVIH